MSKEATGQPGTRLGSSRYWIKINHAAGLRDLMGAEPKYHAILQRTGSRASTAISASASIGGSWAGAAVGAKAGAILGVLGGPAAPLTVPVLSLVGGIAGSIGGSRLAKYVVDITYAEE